MKIFNIFTTREIASCIWFLIICIAVFSQKHNRKSINNVIKCALNKYIIVPFFILILYSITIALVLNLKINILKFIKDIILWVIFIGVPFVFSTTTKKIEKNYFKSYIVNNIKIITIIEFIISNFTFNIVIELILIPFITFIILLDIVAEKKEENKIAHKFFSGVFSLMGLVILICSLSQAINTYNQYSNIDLLISFLIPFIYSIFFVIVTYFFILYSEYNMLFIRLNNYYKLSYKQKKEILKKINFSIIKMKYFNSNCLYKLYRDVSEEEFNKILEEIKFCKKNSENNNNFNNQKGI